MSNAIDNLCKQLMVRVVNTGCVNEANAELAIKIMRSEMKEFLTGDKYTNERQCVLENTVHPDYIMTTLVLSCVQKIKEVQ